MPALIEFDPDSEFSKSDMPVGVWLKPEKWNQERYDLVSHCSDPNNIKHYLCFVQVTDAVNKTIDLRYIQRLALKASKILDIRLGVEIIVVSPACHSKTQTKIKALNVCMLNNWKIGSTDIEWTTRNIDLSIKYLYFKRQ